jgi:hypothetical protein
MAARPVKPKGSVAELLPTLQDNLMRQQKISGAGGKNQLL